VAAADTTICLNRWPESWLRDDLAPMVGAARNSDAASSDQHQMILTYFNRSPVTESSWDSKSRQSLVTSTNFTRERRILARSPFMPPIFCASDAIS
jgi:hypothetical protein